MLRRGSPVAHSIYGIPQTINSANYVYFSAFRELERLQNPQLFEIFCGSVGPNPRVNIDELMNLHRGQGMDIYWRESLICPSVEEYIEMIKNKTGGLLRLAVRLMQEYSSSNVYCPKAFSFNTRNYAPIADLIGILFQIRDDYLNLQDPEYMNGKGLSEDITEGKFSFPMIHSISINPHDNQVISLSHRERC